MIRINDKSQCSGCTACFAVCPKGAVSMKPDRLGFMYPEVDSDKCISCGLCIKVCPYGSEYSDYNSVEVYAAFNKNESVRARSSSGGVFTEIASKVIENDGVVFGAAFSGTGNGTVEHVAVSDTDSLPILNGSKYVQSDMSDVFCKVRELLDSGRTVLFSGTPCQVAGLNRFLGDRHDGLMSVACACHGVPSPEVWRRYYQEVRGDSDQVSFRDKSEGWKNYMVRIGEYSCKAFSDPYMRAMIKGITLRPSCVSCKFKGKDIGCDMILGDWWSIGRKAPEMDDDKGTSAVLVFSEQGRMHIEGEALTLRKMPQLDDAGNAGFNTKIFKPFNQDMLVDRMEGEDSIYRVLKSMTDATLYEKVARRVKRIFKK